MDLNKYSSLSNVAKTSYEKSAPVNPIPKYGFSAFRDEIRRERVKAKKFLAERQDEINRINTEYRPAVAKIKIDSVIASEASKIHMQNLQNGLFDSLRFAVDAKRDAIDKYLLRTPSPEQLSLINALQIRGGQISPVELESYIKFCSTSYVALSTLNLLSKDETGMPAFRMPFDPQQTSDALDKVSRLCERAIVNLFAEDITDIQVYELLDSDVENSNIERIFNEIDSATCFTEEDGRTIIEKLSAAIDKNRERMDRAREAGDANEIKAAGKDDAKMKKFVMEHAEELQIDAVQKGLDKRILEEDYAEAITPTPGADE